MILSRTKFAEHFNKLQHQLGDPNSPLWVPEMGQDKYRSQWFVCVKPVIKDKWSEKKKRLLELVQQEPKRIRKMLQQ